VTGEMKKTERAELASVVRMRARVARADIDANKAKLLADFEEQIATKYAADDERWAQATAAAKRALAEAEKEVQRVCDQAGVPREFRPSMHMWWSSRGENASSERRAELRRVASSRLDAQTRRAKIEVDRAEASLRGELAAAALTSEQAKAWLERLPSVDELMPRLRLPEVEVEVDRRSRHLRALTIADERRLT
jgi:hypothetical protein